MNPVNAFRSLVMGGFAGGCRLGLGSGRPGGHSGWLGVFFSEFSEFFFPGPHAFLGMSPPTDFRIAATPPPVYAQG